MPETENKNQDTRPKEGRDKGQEKACPDKDAKKDGIHQSEDGQSAVDTLRRSSASMPMKDADTLGIP